VSTALARARQRILDGIPDLPPHRRAEALKCVELLTESRLSKRREVKPEFSSAEQAKEARGSLRKFIEIAWQLVEPAEEFKSNWHIDTLCEVLEKVSLGEIKRIMINIPPGTMKSLLVSVFWPAWEWASNPSLRYLTGSYSDALTIRDNLRLREIITSDWYKEHYWNEDLAKEYGRLAIKLKGDQNEKVRFDTTATGWRIATGIGGRGVGEHPDRVIIDDPLSPLGSTSEKERMGAWNWIKRTLSTRGKARNARFVLIMQRLHEQDPSGEIIAMGVEGGWVRICWPMRYEADPKLPAGHLPALGLDDRTEEGELLWPKLFDEASVRQLEIDLDPYGAAGQLQQRPAPEGGGLFKREWWKFVDRAPVTAKQSRGWDVAGTEDGGDWTVGVKMSRDGTNFYIEDEVRGQWSAAGVDSVMKVTADMDGRACSQREEQEGGSAGKAVISARKKLLVGYDYGAAQRSGDKIVCAKPYRAQVEDGNVFLVRGAWNSGFIAEHEVFPNGKNDDRVDAAANAFIELALGPRPVRKRRARWG